MSERAAVCLGFRNWHLDHLQRCLTSLTRWRTLSIFLTDLGSTPAVREGVHRITRKFGRVSVLDVPSAEWSRSLALNRAAQAACDLLGPQLQTLVFTDADMLFPERWFDGVAAVFAQPSGWETFWLTDSRDLPPGWEQAVPSTPITDEFLLEHSLPHPRIGQGAAMVVPRAWFDTVGGFDETYRVWGCEDNDLTLRAQWSGLPVTWLPDAWVAHQWHPRDWATEAQFEQVRRNRAYFAARLAARGPIVRNRPEPVEGMRT